MLDAGLFDEGLPKCDTFTNPLAHELKTALGHAHKHHRVLKASRSESALSNGKPLTFAENHILPGHADIFKDQLTLTSRRMIAAKGFERTDNLEAWGIDRDEDG